MSGMRRIGTGEGKEVASEQNRSDCRASGAEERAMDGASGTKERAMNRVPGTTTMDRVQVRQVFAEYTAGYDLSDPKIALKAEHTYKVAELCEEIARSLELGERDVDLAWLSGMWHDIGRFEQVRRYGTFLDAVSVNHAALSADILFHDGLAGRFAPAVGLSEEERALLERAVRLHNVFALPEGLSERERMFCQILRDADKIDILRVNVQTPLSEIYDDPIEEIRQEEISDATFADLQEHHTVLHANRKSTMDRLVSHAGLVYGLVYPKSVALVREQGYLRELLSFASDNPRTRERLSQIGQEVQDWISAVLQE